MFSLWRLFVVIRYVSVFSSFQSICCSNQWFKVEHRAINYNGDGISFQNTDHSHAISLSIASEIATFFSHFFSPFIRMLFNIVMATDESTMDRFILIFHWENWNWVWKLRHIWREKKNIKIHFRKRIRESQPSCFFFLLSRNTTIWLVANDFLSLPKLHRCKRNTNPFLLYSLSVHWINIR